MESTCKTKRTRPHTGLSEPSCWLPVRLGCMHPMVYMHALDNVSKLRPRHEPVESLATPIDHVVPCHPARKGKQEDLWDTADAARRWSSAQDARKRPSFTARHRQDGSSHEEVAAALSRTTKKLASSRVWRRGSANGGNGSNLEVYPRRGCPPPADERGGRGLARPTTHLQP